MCTFMHVRIHEYEWLQYILDCGSILEVVIVVPKIHSNLNKILKN